MLTKLSVQPVLDLARRRGQSDSTLPRLSRFNWGSVATLNLVFVLLPWMRDIWGDYFVRPVFSEIQSDRIFSHGSYFAFIVLPVLLMFFRVFWAAWIVNVRLMLTALMCLLNLLSISLFDMDSKFYFMLVNSFVLVALTTVFLVQERIRRERDGSY